MIPANLSASVVILNISGANTNIINTKALTAKNDTISNYNVLDLHFYR